MSVEKLNAPLRDCSALLSNSDILMKPYILNDDNVFELHLMKRKTKFHCYTSNFRLLLTILFTVFALRIAVAQPLSVSPASFDLGRFPAWKAQAQTFTIRNIGESNVNLLRVRSSCSCLAADFQPCAVASGQETSLTVTIAANSVSGDFSKAVFLETDAPGQEFLKLTVSGTSVLAVEVRPKSEVYLGRLETGKERVCVFRLRPGQLRNIPPAAAREPPSGRANFGLSEKRECP